MLVDIHQLSKALAVYKNLGVTTCLYAEFLLTELGLVSHSQAGISLNEY